MATISGVHSCLYRTYTRCGVLIGDRCCDSQLVTHPAFIQLLDDDIVSLTALTLIVKPECRQKKKKNTCSTEHNQLSNSNDACIGQLTLSLYLVTRCQLRLRHSVTSLVQTLKCIKRAQRKYDVDRTLDQLTLKLSARKLLGHLQEVHGISRVRYIPWSRIISVELL